jgi:hypothetical protein
MEAVVRWSTKPRVAAVLSVPALGWLARWSFTTTTNPSEFAGCAFIAMAALAALFAAHTLIYRLRASAAGIVEQRLWGTRRTAWNDVLKVEGIAQESRGGAIYRAPAAAEDAFHLVLHTRQGRINVNRWMDGIDPLVEVLRARPDGASYRANPVAPLDRDDPSVKPVLAPSPARDAIVRATDALLLVKVVVLVLPLSWIAGLIAALELHFSATGNPLVDATLLALVPWGLGYLAYVWVEAARRRRFGAAHAKPALGARDAILTMAAAMGGPMLVAGFAPRLVASFDRYDAILAALGLFLCWLPVAEVRRQLARP